MAEVLSTNTEVEHTFSIQPSFKLADPPYSSTNSDITTFTRYHHHNHHPFVTMNNVHSSVQEPYQHTADMSYHVSPLSPTISDVLFPMTTPTSTDQFSSTPVTSIPNPVVVTPPMLPPLQLPPPILPVNNRSNGDGNMATVVDLTEDSTDDCRVIDLTSPTTPVISGRRQQMTSLGVRSSCRFANAQDSDVIHVETTNTSKPHRRRSRNKSKEHRNNPYNIDPVPQHHHDSDSNPSATTSASIKCPVCLETSLQFEKSGSKLVSTVCGHVFCSQCLRNSITTMHRCPTCRKKLTLKQYHQLFL